MLKGKTTIQLFDAKTGEKTDEVTKTNLVTNAVRNALGGAFNHLASGNAWSKGAVGMRSLYNLPEGKSFAQALYGGVLIFSKPIIEDVDHCLPTIEEIKSFIGSANQSASDGSDSFRGSINEGESEIGTNYVKFVWDFKTNECNGDIASICLTSDCGGAVGYGFDVKKESYIGRNLRNICNFTNDPVSIWDSKYRSDLRIHSGSYTIGSSGALIGTSRKNLSYNDSISYNYSYIDGEYINIVIKGVDYRKNISKFTSKDKFGLSVIDGFNSGFLDSFETIDTGVTDYNYNWIDVYSTSKNYAYAIASKPSYSKFEIVKYSGAGVAERITIPTSNINSAIAAYFGKTDNVDHIYYSKKIFHNDKLYIITGQLNYTDKTANPDKLRVWVLNFDGTYTYKDVALTSNFIGLFVGGNKSGGDGSSVNENLGGFFGEYRGSLCYIAPSKINGVAWFLVDDDGTMQTRPFMLIDDDDYNDLKKYTASANLIDSTDFIPNPYITICKRFTETDDDIYILFYTPLLVSAYLGTINNQETVLTKTPDKTMKIIYTLTQA